ncbi:DUF1997 domain-containing protein [Cephalotus follicularis]|uniref:DUF1997 domain-containing protein n=1 Tax=Cephalotus follicularis TaxID=3775 RepID=A0A1Q3B6Z7_CEPFO|nr:DUF1997 domain-containing protein [Cephalotus follicularis]
MKLYKLKPCVTYSNRHSMSNTSNAKKANLSAMRKERIKLPIDDYAVGYHIGELFSHPSGIQAILNTGTLQRFQLIDSDTNTYRCTLPKIKLFNFQVAPVLDLRITPTNKDCKLELLSFKVSFSTVSYFCFLNGARLFKT